MHIGGASFLDSIFYKIVVLLYKIIFKYGNRIQRYDRSEIKYTIGNEMKIDKLEWPVSPFSNGYKILEPGSKYAFSNESSNMVDPILQYLKIEELLIY